LAGRWRSIYDGKRLRSSPSVQIHHVVPLKNAWDSGARRWSPERRERFANDLTDPEVVAVSASANESKGDSGPDEWKPPRRAVWCLYARWWINVKDGMAPVGHRGGEDRAGRHADDLLRRFARRWTSRPVPLSTGRHRRPPAAHGALEWLARQRSAPWPRLS
jgi:hypothetical protein